MSLNHSTSVVTTGLVMYYDMSNTQKSWRGAPTTNTFTYSSSLSNWSKSGGINTIIDNAATAPDASKTAALVTANGTTNSFIYTSGAVSSGTTYTKSIYAKAVSTNILVFETYDNNGAGGQGYYSTTFNLSAGTITGTAAGDTATIINLGNGWYRCSTTRAITLSNSLAGTFYIGTYGTGTGSVYLWRPQLEIGSFATPPIITGAASASRSDTQAIIDLTGKNTITATSLTYASDGSFSFNGSSNYILASASSNWAFGNNGSIEQWIYVSGNSGTNNRFWCTTNTSSGLDAYLSASSYNIGLHGGIVSTTTPIPSAQWVHLVVTYTNGTIAVYFNGVSQGLTGTTTGYNITNNSALYIGQYAGGGSYYFNGKITLTKVYSKALTAAEILQNFNALRGRYGI